MAVKDTDERRCLLGGWYIPFDTGWPSTVFNLDPVISPLSKDGKLPTMSKKKQKAVEYDVKERHGKRSEPFH